MSRSEYRIESNRPLTGRLLLNPGAQQYVVKDRALAVSLAAKSSADVPGQRVRVVHVPTGEIVFSKGAERAWHDPE